MRRRSHPLLLSLVLAVGVAAALAPAAAAQTTAPFAFEHDDTLDGTPNERQSGYFGAAGSDPADSPAAQRETLPTVLEALDADADYTPVPAELTYETFEFAVAPGEVNGSFTVQLNWGNPNIDFDMYIYRERPNGTLDPEPVAQSATGDPEESATYVSPTLDAPVEAGTYVIFVDNWCSSDTDANSVELNEDVLPAPFCDIGPYADEDDFTGRVTFEPLVLANKAPRVTLAGPTSGRAGDRLTFTATGTDSDGQIARYGFDLDGDGNFEYDNAGNRSVTRLFDQPGAYNVGVRAIDDRGGVAYASLLVTISGAPVTTPPGGTKPVSARNLIRSFRLGSPVFGGRRNRALVVRYSLRERATVSATLYRKAGKRLRRVKRISRGVRAANRTYRVRVGSRRLRRGTYVVRLAVQTSDGRRKVARLTAKRL